MRIAAALLCLLVTAQVPAQGASAEAVAEEQKASLEDLRAFEAWMSDYSAGAFRLMKGGEDDHEALAEVDRIMTALARWDTMVAARKLFGAALLHPDLPGAASSTERVTFYREMQPWKVRALARKHVAAMTCAGLDGWLESHLAGAFGEANKGDERAIAATLRIVGERGTMSGLLALMRATGKLSREQRVKAVNALSQVATVETVPQFIRLLRDVEPNVRIAALNALGKAMGPVMAEPLEVPIDPEIAKLGDRALKSMGGVLRTDKIWQVRSAAAENLARLRTKRAIPLLIAGLKGELRRNKDPWAMDMRLHRLLEGMTGQKMLAGDVKQWEGFWRANGAAFAFAPKGAPVPSSRVAGGGRQYQKFFNLDLESDRLLFVLDFSGSMAEKVSLQAKTTGADPGEEVTKAHLVVEELKKIVMALSDGSVFNVIVFGDEVRVWRQRRDGRPDLVVINDETRDDLLGSYLDNLRPAGATNLYGALSMALDFQGRGLHDKYYELGFDTVYIMSDGEPSWGEIIDTDEILQKVREANALKRLTLHTVTFGDKNEMEFLRRLAEQNGGRHIHVE